MSRTPPDLHQHAPALGEHTAELLAEAGYSAEEIAAMEEKGAAKGIDVDARARASATRDPRPEAFRA
jgi:hypothetical protein